MESAQLPRLGFVMEQTLGHVTHYTNLRRAVDSDRTVLPTWYPLTFEPQGRMENLPMLRSNWSARASWRAWRSLAHADVRNRHDALFFHTQVTTLLSARLMTRVPSVISLDATPVNYDSVGGAYGHRRGNDMIEHVKRTLNARSMRAAGAFITWCEWAKRSLTDNYGVDTSKVTVIAPGVDLDLWPRPSLKNRTGPLQILFVGGDFARKGGDFLLQAFDGLQGRCELHLVTKAPVVKAPGIFVYSDVGPNSDTLRRLYATADIFVLPTLADCFPLVTQEAMAAGLPVIATAVGAISEGVRDGETGLLIPTGDVRALRGALDCLVSDSARRQAMGTRGRELAELLYDSATNAQRIVNIMRELVDSKVNSRS